MDLRKARVQARAACREKVFSMKAASVQIVVLESMANLPDTFRHAQRRSLAFPSTLGSCRNFGHGPLT